MLTALLGRHSSPTHSITVVLATTGAATTDRESALLATSASGKCMDEMESDHLPSANGGRIEQAYTCKSYNDAKAKHGKLSTRYSVKKAQKKHTRFSNEQVAELKRKFHEKEYPSEKETHELAD